ncbi:hypothetical protein JMA_32640 [Jeotgalibacillus malaysiensis]|uniref:HTH cro/C1-type domain-containing protein n=1 Tax=Jeotgalibacillus malaysiensis TaxID=1508404 RepID=A0A0B5AR66_9BACL|nr:helix-turn-helix transcriptional regulator [Jeotgalibacillus malaysiensis]AJD92581.1 hypothetical protein JMA_32640 [Jeotgalibacillus malaysiensis]
MNFIKALSLAMEEGNVKINTLAKNSKISRNTISHYLNGTTQPNEQKQQQLINGLRKSVKHNGFIIYKYLVPLTMKEFQRKGVADEASIPGEFINIHFKNLIESIAANRNRVDTLTVSSSIGKGTAAKSVWVNIKDKRTAGSGILNGLQIGAFLNKSGDTTYIGLMNHDSEMKLSDNKSLNQKFAARILATIKGNPQKDFFTDDPVNLGDVKGSSAEKIQESVMISRAIPTFELSVPILLETIYALIDLYYDLLYQEFLPYIKPDEPKTLKQGDRDGEDYLLRNNSLFYTATPPLYELMYAKTVHEAYKKESAKLWVHQVERTELLASTTPELGNKIVRTSIQELKDYDIESYRVVDGEPQKVFIKVVPFGIIPDNAVTFELTDSEKQMAFELKENYIVYLVTKVGFTSTPALRIIHPYSRNKENDLNPHTLTHQYRVYL